MNKSTQMFSDHYKFIGELKAKHEAKQEKKLKLVFIGAVIIMLCGIWL